MPSMIDGLRQHPKYKQYLDLPPIAENYAELFLQNPNNAPFKIDFSFGIAILKDAKLYNNVTLSTLIANPQKALQLAQAFVILNESKREPADTLNLFMILILLAKTNLLDVSTATLTCYAEYPSNLKTILEECRSLNKFKFEKALEFQRANPALAATMIRILDKSNENEALMKKASQLIELLFKLKITSNTTNPTTSLMSLDRILNKPAETPALPTASAAKPFHSMQFFQPFDALIEAAKEEKEKCSHSTRPR